MSLHRIELSDYSFLQTAGLRMSAAGKRITRQSLRRTGQAPLDASGSTGQLRSRWLTPALLGQVVSLALPSATVC